MSNDATAVVLTPAILTPQCDKAKVKPLPLPLHLRPHRQRRQLRPARSPTPPTSSSFTPACRRLAQWLALLRRALGALHPRHLRRHALASSAKDHRKSKIECEEDKPVKLTAEWQARPRWASAFMIAVLLAASAMKKDLGLPTCLAALVPSPPSCSIKAKQQPDLKLFQARSAGATLVCSSPASSSWSMPSKSPGRAFNLTQHWLAWASTPG